MKIEMFGAAWKACPSTSIEKCNAGCTYCVAGFRSAMQKDCLTDAGRSATCWSTADKSTSLAANLPLSRNWATSAGA